MLKIFNDSRSNLLAKNVIASFLVKGWSAVVVLLIVPITLNMLGSYNNGVWMTISGILMWIDFMDIGLGNGLRNVVANNIATGNTEKVREAVSSTFFMLVAITIPIICMLYATIYLLDINAALGVDKQLISNLDTILVVAVTLACSTFILKSVGNFYMGLQLPAINNLIVCLGQTLALLLTWILYLLGSRSLLTVVVVNTSAPLIVWLLSFPYTFYIKYTQYRPSLKCVSMQMAHFLCIKGVQFFVLQICAVILFTSTNIIISRIFSPSEVTPYQIAYRYFSIMLVVFNTICMPFWNATTDAYTRGDNAWILKASHKLNLLVMAIGFGLILMVAVSNFVYRVWIGQGIEIPMHLSVTVALYIFILCVSLRYSYILNGINVLRIQMVFTITATVVFLPIACLVCEQFGTVTSLVLVMCIVNIPGLIANMWKYHQIFHST